jgi:polysaccharide chain length determinant protein (PEP-CTERM system associated)
MLPGRKYTPSDIINIAWRWKWLIVVPWVLTSIGAVLYSRSLPDVYRSTSLIQIIPQRVPTSYVQSTITSSMQERLPALQQQILSRTRLERIIQDFALYQEERQSGQLMEDIVNNMRNRVGVASVKGDAFQVSFTSDNPRTAMRVTERLASLFVEENLRDREVLAEGANQFLDSQLDDSRRRLLDHEKKLEDYRREHAGELPSQQQALLQGLGGAQGQVQGLIESINRDRDRRLVLERTIVDLEAEAAIAPAVTGVEELPPNAPAAARLEQARLQYEALELRFKADHPDMQRNMRVIRELEAKAAQEALATPVSVAGRPAGVSPREAARLGRLADTRASIAAIDATIADRQATVKKLQAASSDYAKRLDAIPTRESEMIAMTRDYGTLQGGYTRLLTKSEDAKVAANLERRQIGEQFKVIDAARLPERPFSPDRQRLNLMGIGGGLAIGLALVALIEFKDSSFRGEDDVIAYLALPVLATIPAIVTKADRRKAKKKRFRLMVAGVVTAGLAVGALVAWKLNLLQRLL